MAELLVRAWQPYNEIQDTGDVVVVRPDGWQWGGGECLPEYLVVRLPGVSVETIKHLEQRWETPAEFDVDGIMTKKSVVHKRRRWRVPTNWVDSCVALGQSVVTLNTKKLRDELIASLLDKTI